MLNQEEMEEVKNNSQEFDNIVSALFNTQNLLEHCHRKTKSEPKHVALGEAYEGLADIKDSIIELITGLLGTQYESMNLESFSGYYPEMCNQAASRLIYTSRLITEFAKANDFSSVENLAQDINALGAKLKYKLLLNDSNETLNMKKEDNNYSDIDKFSDDFANYYEEAKDIYGEDLESAYNDFVEMNEDTYGIVSALSSGAKKVANTAVSTASKVGSAGGKLLGSTTKSVVTGAAVGAGVNAMRGKSIVKGAVGGGVTGGAASTLYKQFSEEDTYAMNKNLKSGLMTAGGAAIGAGAGYGIDKIQIWKDKRTVKRLTQKKADKGGKLNFLDQQNLVTAQNRLDHPNTTKAANMISMGAVGAVAGNLSSKNYSNKNTMTNENNYSAEDLFADQFAEYYAETEDIYGEDLEAAYADFIEFSELEVSDETYSEEEGTDEEVDQLANDFADFYSETEDIYGEDLEAAYADFMELSGEDTYSEEGETENESEDSEVDQLANDFADFYSETEDIYGEDLETAYNDFIKFSQEDEFSEEGETEDESTEDESEENENEDEYGLKDIAKKAGTFLKKKLGEGGQLERWIDKTHGKMKKAGISSPYGHQAAFSDEEAEESNEEVTNVSVDTLDMDKFSDGFAEFYADAEDIYGDSDEGLEEAYDDYADILAEQELEAMYSNFEELAERQYSIMDKAKTALTGNKAKAIGTGAAVGAGLGLAGGLIAGSVGADAKERRSLKAKKKAGTLTASEAARYAELKANRRKKIAMGAAAGGAAGAVAGAAANKTGKDKVIAEKVNEAAGKAKTAVTGMADKAKAKFTKKETANSAEDVVIASTEEAKDTNNSATDNKETVKEVKFSAVDLLGRPGIVSSPLASIPAKKAEDTNYSDAFDTKPSGSMILNILGK